MATENALELARLGHFTDPEHAPFKVAHQLAVDIRDDTCGVTR